MAKPSPHLHRLLLPLFALLALATGCHTIEPKGIEAFSIGVSAAKTQTHLAFTTLAQITRQDSIDYASRQDSLQSANLTTMPGADTIAAWDALFATLESYAHNLSTLSGGASSKPFQDAMVKLAVQFDTAAKTLKSTNTITDAPQVSAGLATAFTEAAKLIICVQTRSQARSFAQTTDPEMNTIFTGLADAIGGSNQEGLRRTVRAHWTTRFAEKQTDFLATTKPASRLRITGEAADLLDQQDTEDIALASLRLSFLALAEAHHAIASGHEPGLRIAIDAVSAELQSAKTLHDELNAKLKNQIPLP